MKWLMDVAYIAATNSKCDRKKVGAVIAKDSRIQSSGWNGTLSGTDNCCEEEVDGKIVSKQSVVHAEANAILWAAKEGISLKDTSLFVTMSPCEECAKMIIQAGITKVYYREKYRCDKGIDILIMSKIDVDYI